jgi:hypothetical protein
LLFGLKTLILNYKKQLNMENTEVKLENLEELFNSLPQATASHEDLRIINFELLKNIVATAEGKAMIRAYQEINSLFLKSFNRPLI